MTNITKGFQGICIQGISITNILSVDMKIDIILFSNNFCLLQKAYFS